MERIENVILDMECSISVSGTLEMFQLSRKLQIFAMAMPLIRKNKVEIYLFLPEEASKQLENRIFLEKYHAKLSNNTWVIFLSDDIVADILPLSKVAMINSVYFETMYMENGIFNLNFKFHGSDLQAISSNVMQLISAGGSNLSISMNYMGPRRSVSDSLRIISSHFMLFSVSFISRPPAPNKLLEENPLGLVWSRYIRFQSEEENLHGLYQIKGKPFSMKGVNTINESEGIYETITTNPVLKEFALMANAQSLARFSENQQFDGTVLLSSFITMESHLHSYISLIDSLKEKFHDWSIYIERVVPVADLLSQ
ncbi:MAG: hypothetical protein B2I17_03435 [Thermoplasmatales archaeon B_DKE]|nr:MAG: hypothetical protein B2I17_03435 [Thermoplasmatales archaeon B_DKE]